MTNRVNSKKNTSLIHTFFKMYSTYLILTSTTKVLSDQSILPNVSRQSFACLAAAAGEIDKMIDHSSVSIQNFTC